MMRSVLGLVLLSAAVVRADLAIYNDGGGALAAGWEDWSWSSTIDYAATDLTEGTSSISINSQAWAAFSPKYEGLINTYAGLQFDVAGSGASQVQLYISSSGDGNNSVTIPLNILANFSDTAFTTILIDFSQLPPAGAPLTNDTWDRLNWQAQGNGAVYHLDNISLLSQIVVTPEFLSAEPLGNNVIAATTQGDVDLTQVSVYLNGTNIPITGHTTSVPVDAPKNSITYFALKQSFAPGILLITAGNATFNFTIPNVQYGAITLDNNVAINPLIYGVNFPTSTSYIEQLGVTTSRWGGNAVTAYNPNGQFTNAGSDWYFENRAQNPTSEDWLAMVHAGGSQAMLVVPSLDWVSKDATSYSYPATVYPDQSGFDPYLPDAGSGLFPNGSSVTPVPNQALVYTPWNTSLIHTWLSGLQNIPEVVFVDNEIEIASSTHQDMHPVPMSYDEELARVINVSTTAKSALPNVKVAAPSTCSWWFYWTSDVGYTDNAAHYNLDFLPWFLSQMHAHDTAAGKRFLDYLDIHYYFQADTSANDAAAKALRLRMTRSLWDPSYVDESWIGTSTPQNHQPNPTAVWLIPRFKELIAANYPGTLLSISEFSSSDDTDITGGLVTADMLGLFGVYGVDSATYWATPDEMGPIGLAYWLYNGYGTKFGDLSVQVSMSAPAPANGDVLGVYASKSSTTGKVSVVLINKDVVPVSLAISNIPTGTYLVRHFGGLAGTSKWQTTENITTAQFQQFFVVPSYTAVFYQQQ